MASNDYIITNQAEWIRKFNDETREHFNPDLFKRDNYELIDALKDVIYSCQRDKYFTIRVDNFTVVESYEEIYNILYDYEQAKIDKNKNNIGKVDNPHKFINIKDTDMMLLIVDYFISVNDPLNYKGDTLRVILEVPRIVDKYYYRINGNYFSAIYQIVDGSTYNNTSSNSKKQSVTFKNVFIPVRIYRNTGEGTDSNGQNIKYTTYSSNIFTKNVPVVEYIFAKYGLYNGLKFLGLSGIIILTKNQFTGIDVDDRYFFNINDNLYIYVPKVIFDSDLIVQCTTMALVSNLTNSFIAKNIKNSDYRTVVSEEYWLKSLALRFGSKPTVEKGLSILDSLESILDIDTKKTIRLLPEDKEDIYTILRWLIRSFPILRLKDNADISIKKIRRANYLASIYASKISTGIYRASDSQKKITVEDIKRFIRVEPDFLINCIVKDKLVPFRNTVNDNDAFTALKFSFKGRSGLGESVNSTIPDSYRHLHPSALTNIDPDTSSASDPGLTGIICPMAKIYNDSFAPKDYIETNDWEENFEVLKDQYFSLKSKKQIITFKKEFDDIFDIASNEKNNEAKMDVLDYCIEQNKKALECIKAVDDTTEYKEATVIEDTVTNEKSFIIWND